MRAATMALTAAVCSFSSTASAGDGARGFGFRGEVSSGVADAALGAASFSATGTVDGSARTLTASGHALGLDHVALTTLALHLQFGFVRHLALGITVAGLWGDATLAGGIDATAFAGHLSGVAFGPELSTFWRVRWLEARASVTFGDRTIWLPVVGLDRALCAKSGVGSHFACDQNASSNDFFVEPRLTVGIMPIPVLSFGGYVGGDVMPSGGWSAGAFVAASTPAWSRAGW